MGMPGLEPSMPGLEPTMPGLEPAMPGLEPDMPGLEPIMPGLETIPVMEDFRVQRTLDTTLPDDVPTILVTNFRDDIDEVCTVECCSGIRKTLFSDSW